MAGYGRAQTGFPRFRFRRRHRQGEGALDRIKAFAILLMLAKGTLDAMFHGSMWDPPGDVRKNISEYKAEV